MQLLRRVIWVAYLSIVLTWACGGDKSNSPDGCEGPDVFGIFSENLPDGVQLDVDAKIGVDFGGGGHFVPDVASGFVDDDVEKREASVSKRSTVNVGSSGQFAIWFVQQGITSSDSDTKDMCAYSQGRLRFWVKSPIDLLIGIRSGNVRAGDETSKALLSQYPSFQADNEWHDVSIPLSDFAGSAPKADLSRIKVFFVIGSSSGETGGTNGDATFWVDGVRWIK